MGGLAEDDAGRAGTRLPGEFQAGARLSRRTDRSIWVVAAALARMPMTSARLAWPRVAGNTTQVRARRCVAASAASVSSNVSLHREKRRRPASIRLWAGPLSKTSKPARGWVPSSLAMGLPSRMRSDVA